MGREEKLLKQLVRDFLRAFTLLKQGVNEGGLIFMFMVSYFFT